MVLTQRVIIGPEQYVFAVLSDFTSNLHATTPTRSELQLPTPDPELGCLVTRSLEPGKNLIR